MVIEYREKIVALSQNIGPVVPTQVAKELKTDSLMASAMLSELVAKGMLKISFLKVGSSPLYYLPNDGARLQDYMQHLNPKDKRTVEQLREYGVVRDREQDPLTRVSLRQVKDFAVPLEVSHNSVNELFWKWYLLEDMDAEVRIRAMIDPPKAATVAIEPAPFERVSTTTSEKHIDRASVAWSAPVASVQATTLSNNQAFERVNDSAGVSESRRWLSAEVSTQRESTQTELPNSSVSELSDAASETTIEKSAISKEESDHLLFEKKVESDLFYREIVKFFDENKVVVVSRELVKMNKEFDFIIDVNSAMGNVRFFCKAKYKKSVSDGDLTKAYVQGQLRKLPTLFISTGTLTKKAEKMLGEELNGMLFKKMV